MDYVSDLRRLIGHRPIILVGAAMLIVDPEGRLLLLKRTDNACWGPPGGSMEPGEKIEDTARREAHEETGFDIGEMSLFGVFSGPEYYYEYPNGDQVNNLIVVYQTQNVVGELKLAESEHTEARYFSPGEIPNNISPPVKPIIQKFLENQILY